ncbi:TatD family hydrolase, partial [Candidatus Woesearchaeota archaeon]|nr:TatD family hydrolase [Candidatus Woesearchaeota archaeon]
MKLVDVHCHLNHEYFQSQMAEVLKRAEEAGVSAIVTSGVNPPANREVMELVRKHPLILRASLGIYPIDALGLSEGETGLPRYPDKISLEEEFAFIKQAIYESKDKDGQDLVVSIGEVGMDFHWAKKEETFEKQASNFRKIIQFAISIKKPLVIHSRKAEKECLDILEEEIKNQEIKVDLHCFSGNKRLIERAAKLGYYFSIPPNIIKLQHFQTLVQMVDIKQLLTETDAPW